MPLNSQNDKAQIEESSVADWGRRWSVAVGRLLRIFTDVRAFSAKSQKQRQCVPMCVYLLRWQLLEDFKRHVKRAAQAF